MPLIITALNTVMLIATNKSIMLSVVMLNVIMLTVVAAKLGQRCFIVQAPPGAISYNYFGVNLLTLFLQARPF